LARRVAYQGQSQKGQRALPGVVAEAPDAELDRLLIGAAAETAEQPIPDGE
jgi:hypothetical protein